MPIRKQGKNTWEVRVYLPNPSSGRAERRSFTVRGSYQDARREEARLKALVSDGTMTASGKFTVEQYTERWLSTIKTTVRESTMADYTGILTNYVNPYIGEMRLDKVTGETLNALYGKLLTEGGTRVDGLSSTTVLRTHAVLHRMFRDAVKWGHLVRNPVDQADPPRDAQTDMDAWSKDELAEFLAAESDDPLYHALWHTAAYTGLRRGEIIGLTWGMVDIDKGRIRVRSALVDVNGKYIRSEPKTAAGRRDVALDESTREVLERHRRRLDGLRSDLGLPALGADDPVFWKDVLTPITPPHASRQFTKRAAAHGIRKIRFHDLRHTHATLMLEAGVPIKVVSDRLGHSSIKITLDTYTHPAEGQHDEAAAAFSALFN